MHILVCEDENRIATFLEQGLSEEGHDVVRVDRGLAAINASLSGTFDILLLDLRLPDMDGISVCQTIRHHHPDLPILMLTALDAVEDRVTGLKAGADDYLPKPFAFSELLARIEALHRRSARQIKSPIHLGDFQLDVIAKTCTFEGKEIPFTVREFELFSYFLARIGQVIPREALYRDVWQMPFEPNTNVVDVYVNYLRQKLREHHTLLSIETLRGKGFRMNLQERG